MFIGGISNGAVYALMAAGFCLLWQTSRTVNFAQGDFAAVPAFVFTALVSAWAWPIAAAILAAVAVAVAVLGLALRVVVIARLLSHGLLPVVVGTLALSIVIQNSILLIWGPNPQNPPTLTGNGRVVFGEVAITYQNILQLAVAGVAIIGLFWFLRATKAGKALQATAQNARAATIVGIRASHMITIAFVVNAVLVAVAGILISPVYLPTYDMGSQLGLNAFYAAIIGGFNRIQGSLLGGILLGVFNAFVAAYVTTSYREGVVLALLFVIIMVKPEGLMGTKELVKEYQ